MTETGWFFVVLIFSVVVLCLLFPYVKRGKELGGRKNAQNILAEALQLSLSDVPLLTEEHAVKVFLFEHDKLIRRKIFYLQTQAINDEKRRLVERRVQKSESEVDRERDLYSLREALKLYGFRS